MREEQYERRTVGQILARTVPDTDRLEILLPSHNQSPGIFVRCAKVFMLTLWIAVAWALLSFLLGACWVLIVETGRRQMYARGQC